MYCRRWYGLMVVGCAVFLALSITEAVERGPAGSFIRFRVDALPPGGAFSLQGALHIHASPWTLRGLNLTPQPVSETGWTPWVNLAALPGGSRGSLVFTVPDGARGITRFSRHADDGEPVRDVDWADPGGTQVIVTPDFGDVRTFREQERRYYLRTLAHTGERLLPLPRPPLFFGNAWGRATGAAGEYMVKSLRLMGMNSVGTDEHHALYETLYGWSTQDAQYQPPQFMPFDETAALEKYREAYRRFFTGRAAASPDMRVFQMSDEPREIAIDGNSEEANAGFRRWLAAKGLSPATFEASAWDAVTLQLARNPPGIPGPVANRLFYWSRRYQQYLTPRMFSLAAQAIRESAPHPEIQSFVALSGHALYMPSRMPLDMFELAKYPGLMPGISDWMTGGNWNWDSHQAVAFSVAPYNAGARRYGADFGKPPRSFPMMHCVNPSLFRAYTQLANQCKFISYYTYGPDYLATEGFWSNQEWAPQAVQIINRQAALVDDILGPGLMRPSRVAMLYSLSQEVWWPLQSFPDKRATFLALAHEHFQPDLVTEEQIAEGALAHYDALLVLDHFIARAARGRIADWVKGGGLLWACADAGVVDEYHVEADLLLDLAGLKRVEAPSDQSVQFIPRKGETGIREHEIPPRDRFHQIPIRNMVMAEWPGATVRADYGDGHPALAEKQVGKGKVVYSGHRVGNAYSRRAGARGEFRWWQEGYRDVLTMPLREAGIRQEFSVSDALILSGAISTDAGTVMILYPMYHIHQDQPGLTVTLREPSRPHSVQMVTLPTLTDVPFDYADGVVTIRDWTLPGSGAMLVIRRRPAPSDPRLEAMRARAVESLASTDWQALSAGAWFAGFFPEWDLAARLLPLLGHQHWAVRRSAAEALGRLQHRPAANVLRQAIERETDAHALADMLYALARIGHRDAKALARRYREHAHPVIRAEAQRAAELAP